MKFYRIYIFLILSMLGACKTVQLPKEKSLTQMPETFVDSKDTTNIAKIKWTAFFTDEKLKVLIQEGLDRNIDLQNAFQNIELASANQLRAKGMLLPTVDAGASAAVYKYGDYTQEWAGNRTTEMTEGGPFFSRHLPNYYLGLMANWEVDIYGKLKDQNKAAQARFFSTFEGKKWVQTNLISAIANVYYELVALDNQLDIINQNIAIQENSLEIVRQLKEAGRSNELAVKQFEAQILNAKADAKQINQIIVEYESIINLLLARYPKVIDRNKNILSDSLAVAYQSGVPSQLLSNRPDVRMAEQELLATRFDTKVAKKAFYPSFNINAGFGSNGFSVPLFFTWPSAAYSILGGLTAPVFNRKALQADFKTASAIQLTALNNFQQTIISAFTEVYNELKNIENLKEIVSLKQDEVNTLEQAIENADLLFQTNKADYLEVLIAQQNLLIAKLDLQNLKKLQKVSSINLYKVLGGGKE
jgi:outer membrane protein, multidrug efflux system